jgi:hypothetical protein
VRAHRVASSFRPWIAVGIASSISVGICSAAWSAGSRAAFAALELLQRMPQSFVLVLVSLALPDVPGAVLVETLRHFRPDLPLICIDDADQSGTYDISPCLTPPIDETEFHNQLAAAMGGVKGALTLTSIDPEALERARVQYAIRGNLLDAAREIARGVTDEKI